MTLGLKMNNTLTPQQLLEQQLRNQGLPSFGSIGGIDLFFSYGLESEILPLFRIFGT